MKASYLWAALIAILIGGWFASGNLEKLGLKEPADNQAAATTKAPEKKQLFVVEARNFVARNRQKSLVVRGRTQIKKQVSVLARTTGIVEQADFENGDVVKAGDLLCRLDLRDRKARLAQAKANLASRKRNYEAARKLFKKNFASAAKMAADRAEYDAALAAVEQIELEITYTNITAPISGIITTFQGEKGHFLQAGRPCAVISVFDPMLVVMQVGERDIESIRLDQQATARLITEAKISGRVSKISPTADLATRTFKVEVSVANPGNKLRDGITAEVSLPLPPVRAHLIPSGIIGLDDDGQIGVRTIVAGNKVKFMPVRLVGQTRAGTWVQGLPEKVVIITAGQDYVLTGQSVEVSLAGEPAT